MNKILISIFLLIFSTRISAQEIETDTNVVVVDTAAAIEEESIIDEPVSETFSSGYLIDAQTTYIPSSKTLEYVIQHRFGSMSTNGIGDLWGIYAPGANIRMGINYVILKNLQLGWGISKLNMYNDFNIKWTILEQTRKNTIPIAVSLFGDMAFDSRNKTAFGKTYSFGDRVAYFSQLIISRKFNEWLSLQAAASCTHFNAVDSLMEHDKIAIHFNGKMKFSPQGSFIFTYDMPLNLKSMSENIPFTNPPKPNLAFGLEIATSAHAFQIFIGTSAGILPQEIIMHNVNDFTKGGMAFGFVITRIWSF